jgi:Na+/H+-dicarboxylate symporter
MEVAQSGVKKPFFHRLYVQVLIAVVLGVVVGWLCRNLRKMNGSKA